MTRSADHAGVAWRVWAAIGALAIPLAGALSQADEPARPIVQSMPSERRYELLSPGDPKALKDAPVVLYLHPTSVPALDKAAALYWPAFRDRKCLMVMPVAKSAKMWLSGEDKFVLDVLADVRTRYSIDAKRVILMGVSGGGQAALFLADHAPEKFRAVVAIDANPVVVRGDKAQWFYPDRQYMKACPYFALNDLREGSALMYWRQVQAKVNPDGASVTVWPVAGKGEELPPLPREFGPWLDAVLAGKQPDPLPDPQKAAVAAMFDKCVKALPGAIDKAKPAAGGEKVFADGKYFRLTTVVPEGFERSKGEARTDSEGRPLTQLRLESGKWPVFVRFDARVTDRAMDDVLADEERDNLQRGMLYQVYGTGQAAGGGRTWSYKIGSITYPDRRRGWVSSLFIHAAAPIAANPRQWLTVMVTDETQQPDAAELAAALRTALETVTAGPVPASVPATAPARR